MSVNTRLKGIQNPYRHRFELREHLLADSIPLLHWGFIAVFFVENVFPNFLIYVSSVRAQQSSHLVERHTFTSEGVSRS
jgi:hypothetical protein